MPRAIEVKAIEDCTVEGSTATNIMAERQIRRQPRPGDCQQCEGEEREKREGGKEHQALQPPVHDAGKDRLRRQSRAVEEKQEGDGQIGRVTHNHGAFPSRGDQRGDDDGRDKGQYVAIDGQMQTA